MYKDIPTSKVFYRPIEAAIRWAGLLRYLPMILATIASPRFLPPSLNCPRWNECRLYSERIYERFAAQLTEQQALQAILLIAC